MNALTKLDARAPEPVSGLDRDALIARYRRFRAISAQHNRDVMRFIVDSFVLERAKRLGLRFGRRLAVGCEGESAALMDFVVHTAPPGRSRAIDRLAKVAPWPADSDERLVLEAMQGARFSIWRVERRHELAGCVVFDMLRQSEHWLMDEALEAHCTLGVTVGARLFECGGFAMTTGALAPVSEESLLEALGAALPETEDPDVLAQDPRLAATIYGAAIDRGELDGVAFSELGATPRW